MNHRYASAAAVLASAAALLATACGTSDASPNLAASTSTVSVRAASAAHGTSVVTVADAQVRTTTVTAWKPCHLPAGYQHFLELRSAGNVRGKTVVRVTPQRCKVNTENDEDVIYTPSGAARSLTFASGASVKVLRDTNTVKVAPSWLTHHKLANTPYFY
ncbi:hypothetical protein [Streptomyces sp. NPDC056160]|uniref:hypothetical protein n=1 Tax=Streptomyces sp. NPDC056160 TaxID=3345731 RepID=UPI0035D6B8C8